MKTLKFTLYLLLLSVLSTFISNLNTLNIQSEYGIYPFLNWLYINRAFTLSVLTVLIVIVPAVKAARTEAIVKHNVRKKLLKTLITDVFGNETQKLRITIFRDAWRIHIFWIYLKDSFWKLFKREPLNPFPNLLGKFIKVSERVGTENPKSKTYFYFSQKTYKECEGIASYVKQINGDFKVEDLPDINNIDLSDFSKLSSEEMEMLNEYVEKTFLKDIKLLRKLFVKARHFYAIILTDENAVTKAVLVVDSQTETSPFGDDVISKVGGYIKIFSTTF